MLMVLARGHLTDGNSVPAAFFPMPLIPCNGREDRMANGKSNYGPFLLPEDAGSFAGIEPAMLGLDRPINAFVSLVDALLAGPTGRMMTATGDIGPSPG